MQTSWQHVPNRLYDLTLDLSPCQFLDYSELEFRKSPWIERKMRLSRMVIRKHSSFGSLSLNRVS